MKKFVKGMACLLVACACTGCATKTTFAKFCEKAEKAVKETSPYKKATVKGTYKSDDEERKINEKFTWESTTIAGHEVAASWVPENTSSENAVVAAFILAINVSYFTVAEDEDTTYYAGSTFKVVTKSEDGKGEVRFNKYGQITYYNAVQDSDTIKITVAYSK